MVKYNPQILLEYQDNNHSVTAFNVIEDEKGNDSNVKVYTYVYSAVIENEATKELTVYTDKHGYTFEYIERPDIRNMITLHF